MPAGAYPPAKPECRQEQRIFSNGSVGIQEALGLETFRIGIYGGIVQDSPYVRYYLSALRDEIPIVYIVL